MEAISTLWRDARNAVRLLWKSPTFTIVAILTLALGIGANTAIFTIVNALVLRPLPYHDPQDLVLVTSLDRAQQDRVGCLTYPRYTLMAAERGAFGGLAAFAGDTANLTGSGDAEQVQVARVSWNFFELLGVRPALGRGLVRADEESGAAVVISDSLWRRAFRARTDVAGQPITLDGRTRTVAGVLPAGFTFGLLDGNVDVWLPRIDELSLATPEQLRSGTCYLNAVGRLAAGASRASAQAQMDVVNRRYAREFAKMPDADPGRRVSVEPLRDVLVAGAGPMLLTLALSVGVVLLVACANVAGLLLARSLARRRELAMRAALGASRATLVRQLLTESVVLALAGGAIGAVVGVWATRALADMTAQALPRGSEIVAGVDIRVLAFAAGLSVLTGIVFGLSPAIHFSRTDLLALSKGSLGDVGQAFRLSGPRTVGQASRLSGMLRLKPGTARQFIVVAQVALTVVLLVSAGLLVRTFWRLQTLNPGFDASGTLTMNLSLPRARYGTSAQMVAFYQQLLEKLQSLPVARSASLASALPVNPSRASPVLVEGQPVVSLAERPIIGLQMVLGPYFRTMRIPLVRGRTFDERDLATSPPVVIVNEAFVRRFFRGQDPLGKHITLGRRTTPAEIVGVVGDVKNEALASEPAPQIEVPFTQLAWASMNLIVRTGGEPLAAAATIRKAIAALDPNLPATRVQSLDDVLASARARPRMVMTLLSLFAASALVLATIGLYGLIAYSVGQRTHELGIRLALGAGHGELVWMVVRQGVGLAAAGVGIGLVAATMVTRFLASLMYQIGTTDPLAFSVGPAAFLALAALASWIPARRITRVSLVTALRSE